MNSPAETSNRTSKITFLGGFSLTIDGKTITDELNRSMKIWNLLTYLIVHRTRNIPTRELIGVVWPDGGEGNPAGALKALFFRMRKMLASVLGEDIQPILSSRGSYSWNSGIKCIVDVDLFEYMCREAEKDGAAANAKLDLYELAVKLYRGDFLPKLAGNHWTVPFSARFRALYVDMVKKYAALLHADGRFKDMESVCFAAIDIEALDEELHVLALRSLMAQDRNADALAHYEKVTELLYRNFGTPPSKALRAVYSEIMKVQKSIEVDLDVIQDSLREYSGSRGAFTCDFGFFQEAFRLAARQSGRDGSDVHIALITVIMRDGAVPELDTLSPIMERLREIIMQSLRRGDVLSRYSGAQYIVMLAGADCEGSLMVVDRIKKVFMKKHRDIPVQLSCVVRRINPCGEVGKAVGAHHKEKNRR